MSTGRDRLERLLGDSALGALRSRLRRRYERGADGDRFTLGGLSPAERQALEGLLGRRLRSSSSMRLSLTELDKAFVRAGLADSLRDALEHLDGPIQNVAAERVAVAAQWDQVFASCAESRLAGLVGQPIGRGLIKRLASSPDRGAALLSAAASVVALLPAGGVPLSRLAARALGDSHALDEGRPVATILVTALRSEGDERPRETWARMGVMVGELAWPALTFNVPVSSGGVVGQLVARSLDSGQPMHLSLRLLLRGKPDWTVAGRTVFVCENPAVVAMAADALGSRCAPLVCTDGMPSAAQRTLLSQLAAAGASLRYHGDFDWPGIAIGNYVMRTYGARPWRFGADDFDAVSGFALEGSSVSADWDPHLAPKMALAGFGIHEEAVIEALLGDLAEG